MRVSSRFRSILIMMACGILCGVLLAGLAAELALAQSGQKKQCGGNGGTKNAQCPGCYMNQTCDLGTAKYKKCEQAGTGCTDSPILFSCSGHYYSMPKCKGMMLGPCQGGVYSCK